MLQSGQLYKKVYDNKQSKDMKKRDIFSAVKLLLRIFL